MRKTKIICTLGPATDAVLPEMIKAGMNVARMNFSHGSHEEHKARMDAVKAARKELGMPVGIMLDTKGPEIRTKTYKDGKIEIVEGQEFTLTTANILGDETRCAISYSELPEDVKHGDTILLDDGLVRLTVLETTDMDIRCRVENDGESREALTVKQRRIPASRHPEYSGRRHPPSRRLLSSLREPCSLKCLAEMNSVCAKVLLCRTLVRSSLRPRAAGARRLAGKRLP